MHALTIENLKKTYASGFTALNDINLTVKQGDFFALLGPNGAGKTTLIGIIASLVTKTSGKVSIFGHDLDKELEAAKACIGLVPQEFNFGMFERVQEILVNQAGYYGVKRKLAYERAEQYLKQLDLWDKRTAQARMLSGGMKRRLMIARALVHEPRLLILDEPTAGVDIEIRRAMWKFLQELNARGVTIILTTHYLEEAENLCQRIAIINSGDIIENATKSELLGKLNVESYLLYLHKPMTTAPQLDGYVCQLIEPQTLEVQVKASEGLNPMFDLLSQQGIRVVSMKNKVNRLEELFMSLVNL
jgi:ABC-2 type transport system ATP-binding protein